MPPWIHHLHSSYVLAAYAVAGIGLLGLLLWSWLDLRGRQIEWKKLKGRVAKEPRR